MSHPTVHFVTGQHDRTAHIAVHPSFYQLDVEQQRAIWDRAHRMAWDEGWVAPPNEDDLSVVDEDGTERFPLSRRCPVLGDSCGVECRA